MNHLTQKDGHYFWLYDRRIFDSISRSVFTPRYWQERDQVLGQEKGRGTTWFVRHAKHELVLRHYLRGGLVGKLNRDRYLFRSHELCRSIREYRVLQCLHERQLPVPRPAAAQVIRHRLHYRADILIERIPDASDLLRILRQPQSLQFFHRLGKMIAEFHKSRVYHADLNIQNILMDHHEKFWLIDFDRAQLDRTDQGWQQRTLERLKRSFYKERERHHICFEEQDWFALISGYQQALGKMD